MDSAFQELLSRSRAAALEAVRLYFEPLHRLAVWKAKAAQQSATFARGFTDGIDDFLLRLTGPRDYRNVLIIGSGELALRARDVIGRSTHIKRHVIGFAGDLVSPIAPTLANEPIHKLPEVPALIRQYAIDEVLLAVPLDSSDQVTLVIEFCEDAGIPIVTIPQVITSPDPSRVAGHRSNVGLSIKRLMDILLAGTGLILAAPAAAVIALLIRLDSRGPVLFRQRRCGLNGRPFWLVKFRTMNEAAGAAQLDPLRLDDLARPASKVRWDPRITRVGRVLRRLSLDELPQLWNVIVGEMSLVGPRPPLSGEVDQYEAFERRRLAMKPGLTCLWQVSGRTELSFRQWVELDLQYVDNWSLKLDIRILAATVPAVLSGRGAS